MQTQIKLTRHRSRLPLLLTIHILQDNISPSQMAPARQDHPTKKITSNIIIKSLIKPQFIELLKVASAEYF